MRQKKAILSSVLFFFLVVVFVSCNKIRQIEKLADSNNKEEFVFPHPENYASPKQHGVYVVENGKALCAECHGEDYLGGSSNVSCNKCHANYPHETNWDSQDVHGKFVLETGLANTDCKSCHGADYSGAKTGTSCYDCHDMFPHKSAFVDPAPDYSGHHSTYISENGSPSSLCGGCHGADLQGGDVGTGCYDCHDPGDFTP